ncbi:MAG: hypothetical protein AB7V42_12665 [Thermoleophilia bacterium]
MTDHPSGSFDAVLFPKAQGAPTLRTAAAVVTDDRGNTTAHLTEITPVEEPELSSADDLLQPGEYITLMIPAGGDIAALCAAAEVTAVAEVFRDSDGALRATLREPRVLSRGCAAGERLAIDRDFRAVMRTRVS